MEAACIVSQDIYFVDSGFGVLLKITRENGEIQFVSKLFRNIGIIQKLIYWDHQIWMFSAQSDTVLIYDMKNGEWDSLAHGYGKGFDGWCGLLMDSHFYIFNRDTLDIIEINLTERDIRICQDGTKEYFKHTGRAVPEGVHFRSCCIAKEKIYAAMWNEMILEYDYMDHRVKFHTVGKGDRFATVCFDGRYFWLTGASQSVTRWDCRTGEAARIYIDIPGFSFRGKFPFRSSLYWNGSVWLFSSSADRNVKICVWKEKMEGNHAFYGSMTGCRVLWNGCDGDRILFVDAEKNLLVEEDVSGNARSFPLFFHERLRRQLVRDFFLSDTGGISPHKIHKEDYHRICLEDLLKGLVSQNNELKAGANGQGAFQIGDVLYQKLKF